MMSPTSPSEPSGTARVVLTADGPDLTGRETAASIRDRVETDLDAVIFDCEGIDSMSPSFADELFGKLSVMDARPRDLRVANASPDVLAVIRFAVGQRQKTEA